MKPMDSRIIPALVTDSKGDQCIQTVTPEAKASIMSIITAQDSPILRNLKYFIFLRTADKSMTGTCCPFHKDFMSISFFIPA